MRCKVDFGQRDIRHKSVRQLYISYHYYEKAKGLAYSKSLD